MSRRKPIPTCTNHCGACGLHFHSVAAFDMHRVGNFNNPEDPRRCEHPLDLLDKRGKMRLEQLTEAGECRMYAQTTRGVTIWTETGSRERLSALRADAIQPLEGTSHAAEL